MLVFVMFWLIRGCFFFSFAGNSDTPMPPASNGAAAASAGAETASGAADADDRSTPDSNDQGSSKSPGTLWFWIDLLWRCCFYGLQYWFSTVYEMMTEAPPLPPPRPQSESLIKCPNFSGQSARVFWVWVFFFSPSYRTWGFNQTLTSPCVPSW